MREGIMTAALVLLAAALFWWAMCKGGGTGDQG